MRRPAVLALTLIIALTAMAPLAEAGKDDDGDEKPKAKGGKSGKKKAPEEVLPPAGEAPAPGAASAAGLPVVPIAAAAGAVALGGALVVRSRVRRRRPAPEKDSAEEAFEAGRVLAGLQPEPLAAMAGLGLGAPTLQGAFIHVEGTPPPDGCAFRAGYLSGALGGTVVELHHTRDACEFEKREEPEGPL